jgi:hypothetical protein
MDGSKRESTARKQKRPPGDVTLACSTSTSLDKGSKTGHPAPNPLRRRPADGCDEGNCSLLPLSKTLVHVRERVA